MTSNRLRICWIGSGAGGGNRMFVNLYSQLARDGAEVHLITNESPLPGSAYADRLITHWVEMSNDPLGFGYRLARDFRFLTKAICLFFKLHRKIRFHIVHMTGSNFPAVGLVLSVLAKLSGCRAVMEFTSFSLRKEDLRVPRQLAAKFSLWSRWLFPLAFRLPAKVWSWGVDAIIVPSQIGRALLIEIGVEAKKVVSIPPGVDLSVFKPHDATRQPPYRIVYASSCFPWKGTHDLLEAFGIAVSKGFALKLTYLFFTSRAEAGAFGDYISQLERKISDLRLTEQVEIRDGPLEGIEHIIGRADIIACPIQVSLGTLDVPMSVLEGMACGLPVLATKIGGIPEAVVDGVNGYLVEPCAPKKLAEALIGIIQDPDRMRKMGEESFRLAKRFDVVASAALLQERYSVLVGRP